MKLKPKKNIANVDLQKKVDSIVEPGRDHITEEELARIMGMSIKDAKKKAVELNFSRIPVKGTHYYSKKQVLNYLAGKVSKQ